MKKKAVLVLISFVLLLGGSSRLSAQVKRQYQLSHGVSFDRVNQDWKARGRSGSVVVTDKNGENGFEVFHIWGSPTSSNFEVNGKHLDGNSPTGMLSEILKQNGWIYSQLVKTSGPSKSRNKYGFALHYGVLDVRATKDQMAYGPMTFREGKSRGRRSRSKSNRPKAGSLKRLKIYHILMRNKAATRWEHVAIRTTADAYKKNKKIILSIMASLTTGPISKVD